MSDSLDILNCEICWDQFNKTDRFPRILKECGHTVCEECAKILWRRGENRRITCPFDGRITKIRGNIKDLPKNFSLERLLPDEDQPSRKIKFNWRDYQNIPFERNENLATIETVPGKCVRNSNHEAWFTCLGCKADFCERCFDAKHELSHDEIANHEKIPTINKSFQPPKCKKHPTKFADFICQDSACQVEDKVVCNTCLRRNHKGHDHGRLAEVVAESEKKLKEEMCKKAVSKETERYLSTYIPGICASYGFDNDEIESLLYKIKCHYDNQHAKAVKKLRKYAEKTYESGKTLVAEYDETRKTNELLEGIRDEIRGRLASKRKLEDVEDVVERHKTVHEELNRKRDIPIPSYSSSLKLKLPVLEMEITDPELSNTSDDEDSDQPGTSGISY